MLWDDIFQYNTASCNTCTLPSQVSKEADCVKSSSHEQKVDENVVRALTKLSSSSPSVQPAEEVRSLAILVPSIRLLRNIFLFFFLQFLEDIHISVDGGCLTWVTIYMFPTKSPVHIICHLKHKRSWLHQAPGNHWLGRESWKMVKFHWTPNQSWHWWHAGTRGTWPLLGLSLWCQLKVLKWINFFLWLPKCIWQTLSWVQLAKIDEESASKCGLYFTLYFQTTISSSAATLLLASRGDIPSCHTPRLSASLNGRQGNEGIDYYLLHCIWH